MVLITVQILALVALATQFAAAAPAPAPLFITVTAPFPPPDNDTLPISASIVGVDAQGHTTYALQQPELQGTSTLASATGTLVEGSDYVSYTYALDGEGIEITIGLDFSISNGQGIATGLDESSHAATATISSLAAWVLDVPPTGSPGGPQETGKANSARGIAAPVLGALVGLAVGCHLV
ncbi:hypothetical protein C8R44DRAFT_892005 [Mycena epipterygia]|nr:hypothetical protein C8R44DRAFT_892005 [Mycena epipterygia]